MSDRHASHVLTLALLSLTAPIAAAQLPCAGQSGQLLQSGTPNYSSYATSVALDGDVLLVGHPGYGSFSAPPIFATNLGAVEAFRFQNGAWQFEQLVEPKAPFLPTWDQNAFGIDVAVDGDVMVAGRPGITWPGVGELGAGDVFAYQGGAWVQTARLDPPFSAGPLGLRFGSAVAIDGDRIAIGGPDTYDFSASTVGAVAVFERTGPAPGTWALMELVTPPVGSVGDQFGIDVALEGDRLLIGASGGEPGYAVVYDWTGSSWVAAQTLSTGGAGEEDSFGRAVALDGDRALVGAGEDVTVLGNSGAVTEFTLGAGGSWAPTQTLLPTVDGPTWIEFFGHSLALDGDRLLVGAFSGGPGGDGAATLFSRVSGAWVATDLLRESNFGSIHSTFNFGSALALDGERAAVSFRGGDEFAWGALATYDVGTLSGLTAWPPTLSLSKGGVHQLDLCVGGAHGSELYLIAGSATGTAPGIPLAPGVVVPLVPDAYTTLPLTLGDTFLYGGTFVGVLTPQGNAQARFALTVNMDASLAGITLHHAAVVLSGAGVVHATQAASVEFVP